MASPDHGRGHRGSLQKLPLGFRKQAEATRGGQSPGIQVCGVSCLSFCQSLRVRGAESKARGQVSAPQTMPGGGTANEEKTVGECPLGVPSPPCLANPHPPIKTPLNLPFPKARSPVL